MKFSRLITGFKYKANYLDLRVALILFCTGMAIGVIGFMIIEDFTLIEAFYMSVITASTVGFTEVHPLSDEGHIFTSVLILMNIAIFAYAASAFTYFVVQGEIFKKFYRKRIKRKIRKLENHIIICGYGRYGAEIVTHFIKHNLPFLVIDRNRERIENLQEMDESILFLEGDATDDNTLLEANIQEARALITALPDDTDNLFTVLSARQINPSINIISRVKNYRSINKLQLAGASRVIMPEQIGGFYMATLVNKPNAAEFFSFIADEIKHDIDFEEIRFEDLEEEHQNKNLRELKIRERAGANVIGFRRQDGGYVVNPGPDTVLIPNTSFIVLGSNEQIEKVREVLDLG